MKDEQVQSALEMWFEDTDPQPPDPRQTAARVMTRVPQTRQRGRWLPFGLFRQRAQTPTATNTTEYQTSPIPATNGHTPTVIGRTQSMLSPAKAITAGAIVFAIGGASLIAQPFQQASSVPGAEIPAEPEITRVTMTFLPSVQIRSSEIATTNGVMMQTGACWTPALTDASDPRIGGRLIYCADGSTLGGDTLRALTYRIENDEGAWQGSTTSFLPGGEFAEAQTVLLTGEGAYDGWYAWLDVSDWSAVTGSVFDFPPPPAPVPPAAE